MFTDEGDLFQGLKQLSEDFLRRDTMLVLSNVQVCGHSLGSLRCKIINISNYLKHYCSCSCVVCCVVVSNGSQCDTIMLLHIKLCVKLCVQPQPCVALIIVVYCITITYIR